MIIASLIGALFFIFIAAILFLTGVWLWRRATLPEGAPAPKWGDLRFFKDVIARHALMMRLVAAVLLLLVLLIPVDFINDLTRERYDRYRDVVGEISSTWGVAQTFMGPLLSVPYTVRYLEKDEIELTPAELALERSRGSIKTVKEVVREVRSEHSALVLPDDLKIDGNVSTELRSRSIYSSRVFTADLNVSGRFLKSDLSGLRANISEVHWDRATVVVGLTSTKAIRSVGEIELAGQHHRFLPGTDGVGALPTGFSSPIDLSGIPVGGKLPFAFDVSIGGSEAIYFTPLGALTNIELNSEWPHPNFTGSGLPSSRTIGPEGFSAKWTIPNLVRNYPQFDDASSFHSGLSNNSGKNDLSEYVVGVSFFEPVFFYSLMTRAVKYSPLFIALILLGVVICESYASRRGSRRLSAVQMGVLGVGLTLFYLTLLALSEHFGFGAAYLSASALSVAMTGLYLAFALRAPWSATLAAATQALLYGLLFFVMRMEDYALLAGTTLLVLATAALMVVTRNVNRQEGG